MQRRSPIQRLVGLALATVIAMLAASSATADEVEAAQSKRLNGDEIRSQILGHAFIGYYRAHDGAPQTLNAYFSAGGKYFAYVSEEDEPIDVAIKSFEVTEDRLCWHDIGVMKPARVDRCFGVYVFTEDKSWSGYMQDEQDAKVIVALDSAFDADSTAVESRWANWESIRQEAGTLDAFAKLEEVSVNPFRFRGKLQIVIGYFEQMIGDATGRFRTRDGNSLVVRGIPNDMFEKEEQDAVMVGEFIDTMRVTEDGNDRYLPVMIAKATRLCAKKGCKDYIDRY
jgi:hypothetical protein